MSGSRWEVLDRTTPSGKLLFRCSTCGRESITPDKICGLPATCGHDEYPEHVRSQAETIERLRRGYGSS